MIKQFINDLLASLHTRPAGYSFRKLSSILIMILVVYLHLRYINTTNVLTALEYDLLTILTLLGLINLDKFLDNKYGKAKNSDESTKD